MGVGQEILLPVRKYSCLEPHRFSQYELIEHQGQISIIWPFGCSACPGTAIVSQTRGSSGMVSCLLKRPLADVEGKSTKTGQGLLTTCCNGTSCTENSIYILCLPVFTGLLVYDFM